MYGFAKNVRANVSTDELKALKHLAKELLSYSDKALTKAIQYGALVEVEDSEYIDPGGGARQCQGPA